MPYHRKREPGIKIPGSFHFFNNEGLFTNYVVLRYNSKTFWKTQWGKMGK